MYEVKVSDMTCGSCAKSIKNVLQNADSNLELIVDLKGQLLKIQTTLGENVLKNLIEESGFPVKEIKRLN